MVVVARSIVILPRFVFCLCEGRRKGIIKSGNGGILSRWGGAINFNSFHPTIK
jgi:hypothetical protein